MGIESDTTTVGTLKKVNTILISQPKPERSPYFDLEKKWGIKIDWRQFIHVESVTDKEFRKEKVKPDEFTAVIFTSLNSIEHFFRICEGMRIQMSQQTRYFCLTKSIADYLQKFIVYRKRKVFIGQRSIQDLSDDLLKYKDQLRFLLPCSNLGAKPVVKFLEENEYDFKEAVMYRTVASDLSDLSDVTYDMLVFFSPLGIESLFHNFPEFKQNETRLAIFGKSTAKAVTDKGLEINVQAPSKDTPSMSGAIEKYLKTNNV